MQGSGSSSSVTVVAENKSDSVAFMVHPRLTRGKGGDDLTPILWSDNYFSLLPGEKKTVTARFDSAALHGAPPELVVEGWNVEPMAP
jgi:exo-1,4-beta-D-glucosaminidase